MRRPALVPCLLAGFALGLSGCKLVRNEEPAARAAAAARPTAAATATGLWASKVVPYIEAKAVPFPEVEAAARADLKAAGAKYGYREAGEGAPWNFVSRVSGTVTAANLASRLEEVMELSDRIVVMSNGRITGEMGRAAATEEEIVKLSFLGHQTSREAAPSRQELH